MPSLLIIFTVFIFSSANILTSYLYLYPIFKGCAFGEKPTQLKNGKLIPGHAAPFRLLVFGDPQLEGSTSLLNADYQYFPSLRALWQDVHNAQTPSDGLVVAQSHLRDFVKIDIPVVFQSWRKRLDLFGNDFYLAHIYRCLQWFTFPTHTAVLGDLIGSQWISDSEFETRGRRYWERVFYGGMRVEDDITDKVVTTSLGKESSSWAKRIINVAGNHDIGYAGDMTRSKVERFDRVFGRTNWETRFVLPMPFKWNKNSHLPELRIVVLNSLNIDSPALDLDLQSDTFAFINRVIDASPLTNQTSTSTILLTHVPLHKESGVCVDGPHVKYYQTEYGGGIEEQNHLEADSSAGLLSSIFDMGPDRQAPRKGLGRPGIILTGHDHEGCDTYHYLPSHESEDTSKERRWTAEKWDSSSSSRHADIPGIREITVRSMMGDFGGNAGLLSAWFDAGNSRWEFEYRTCPLGKQHLWWAVHVLDIITVPLCIYVGRALAKRPSSSNMGRQHGPDGKEKTL